MVTRLSCDVFLLLRVWCLKGSFLLSSVGNWALSFWWVTWGGHLSSHLADLADWVDFLSLAGALCGLGGLGGLGDVDWVDLVDVDFT